MFVGIPLPQQGVENHNCIALQSAEMLEKLETSEQRTLTTTRSIESYQLFFKTNPVGSVQKNSPPLGTIMCSVRIIVLNWHRRRNVKQQQLAGNAVQDLLKT